MIIYNIYHICILNLNRNIYVFSQIMLQMPKKIVFSYWTKYECPRMDDSDSYFHKRHYLLVFWITHTFLQINIFSWWKFCVERSWQGGGEGSVSQSVWHSLAPVACFCLAVRIPSSFISPLSRSDQQPKCRNLTESWCSTERIIGQKLKMENA